MRMGPIVTAKSPAPAALRRTVGALALLLAALVMLPWLGVHALVAAITLTARAIPAAPHAALAAIDYAGAVALGR